MLEWAPNVPDFPAFVRDIRTLNVAFTTNGWLTFFRMCQSTRATEYPVEAIALASWCLEHVKDTDSIGALEDLAEQLAALPSPPANLRDFLEALCARGSPRALRLADQLNRP